jgi:hypothetical protein
MIYQCSKITCLKYEDFSKTNVVRGFQRQHAKPSLFDDQHPRRTAVSPRAGGAERGLFANMMALADQWQTKGVGFHATARVTISFARAEYEEIEQSSHDAWGSDLLVYPCCYGPHLNSRFIVLTCDVPRISALANLHGRVSTKSASEH